MVPWGENASAAPASEGCPNCSSASVFSEIHVAKAIALGLVLGVFVVFGVLGNMLVILSVVCHSHLRSVTHYFIANLAAADLLLSSAVLPFSAASEALGRWVFGRPFCGVWAALDVLCCTASILSLCVISVDRCLAVSYPLHYRSMSTRGRGLAAVAALWGLSAAISVGPLFGWKEPDPEDETVCRITEEPGYALFSALGSFYVPLAVILVMYCRVYVVARQQTRALREGRKEGMQAEGVALRVHRGKASPEEEEGAGGGRWASSLVKLLRFSREKKAAKTLGIVVGCFVLCWLPFFLVLPIGSIFPDYRPSDTIFKITFWLGYLNSCINPIIYPCFSQEFKKAFQNVLRGRCLRRGGGGPSHTSSPGPLILHRSPPPPSPSPSASSAPRAGAPSPACLPCCWRAPSGSSGSSGSSAPPRSQSARVHSKSLLKAWCFAAGERSGSSPENPRPDHSVSGAQTKVHLLSLGGEAEAV
ncbi:alpha-1A adrenergic receptor [Osmerus eperlanus]|uniref:alpha-1A adrenergic receptor n=1 Tax=Osmerus eperlanus TaxID=29151 RepID=UPI002E167F70